jgi:hypothetical protein
MTDGYIQSTCGLHNGVRFEQLLVDTFYVILLTTDQKNKNQGSQTERHVANKSMAANGLCIETSAMRCYQLRLTNKAGQMFLTSSIK